LSVQCLEPQNNQTKLGRGRKREPLFPSDRQERHSFVIDFDSAKKKLTGEVAMCKCNNQYQSKQSLVL